MPSQAGKVRPAYDASGGSCRVFVWPLGVVKMRIVRGLYLKPREFRGLRTKGKLAVGGKFREKSPVKSGQMVYPFIQTQNGCGLEGVNVLFL